MLTDGKSSWARKHLNFFHDYIVEAMGLAGFDDDAVCSAILPGCFLARHFCCPESRQGEGACGARCVSVRFLILIRTAQAEEDARNIISVETQLAFGQNSS